MTPVFFLVGFMGVGKTTVGRALASRLGVPFYDVDARVEAEAGQTIRELFESEGEPRFRIREAKALRELGPLLGGGAVVATGGGLFADPANRHWIATRGRTVWLDAPFDLILSRCQDDAARPLFGDREEARRLLEERRSGYEQADVRIPVDGRSVAEIVDLILA
ncbi:MAG: shikimate kinase [Candidatus Eiseniibacteriota bacterium]